MREKDSLCRKPGHIHSIVKVNYFIPLLWKFDKWKLNWMYVFIIESGRVLTIYTYIYW